MTGKVKIEEPSRFGGGPAELAGFRVDAVTTTSSDRNFGESGRDGDRMNRPR